LCKDSRYRPPNLGRINAWLHSISRFTLPSQLAIHLAAATIGETEPCLSMTALRAAAASGRKAITDKRGPLAKLAAAR
jgi:hypothetical protein